MRGSHGRLLRAADPLPTSLWPGGGPARTPRFARQTARGPHPRPVLATSSGSPAVLGGGSRDPPPGLGRRELGVPFGVSHSGSGLPSTLCSTFTDLGGAPRKNGSAPPGRGPGAPRRPKGGRISRSWPGAREGCSPRSERPSTCGAPHGSASRSPDQASARVQRAKRGVRARPGGPRSGADAGRASGGVASGGSPPTRPWNVDVISVLRSQPSSIETARRFLPGRF